MPTSRATSPCWSIPLQCCSKACWVRMRLVCYNGTISNTKWWFSLHSRLRLSDALGQDRGIVLNDSHARCGAAMHNAMHGGRVLEATTICLEKSHSAAVKHHLDKGLGLGRLGLGSRKPWSATYASLCSYHKWCLLGLPLQPLEE